MTKENISKDAALKFFRSPRRRKSAGEDYEVRDAAQGRTRKGGFMKFLVALKAGKDGFIIAECPSLPGCMTQGKTREEALANIKEAIELSIETRKNFRLPPQYEIAEIEVAV
ncbi:MAG: type II toxin-antitoxin system HicB family antitoxin [Candidatus Eremiobacteraeota bacterium]|nr:type II toxin-antitoxin system HicB family antitoxin [Candidatus Eremiobacteraeota bacterium]